MILKKINKNIITKKEKQIPLPTDWVVTMVTPIEKVETMYKEDVLNGKTTNQTDSSDESTCLLYTSPSPRD